MLVASGLGMIIAALLPAPVALLVGAGAVLAILGVALMRISSRNATGSAGTRTAPVISTDIAPPGAPEDAEPFRAPDGEPSSVSEPVGTLAPEAEPSSGPEPVGKFAPELEPSPGPTPDSVAEPALAPKVAPAPVVTPASPPAPDIATEHEDDNVGDHPAGGADDLGVMDASGSGPESEVADHAGGAGVVPADAEPTGADADDPPDDPGAPDADAAATEPSADDAATDHPSAPSTTRRAAVGRAAVDRAVVGRPTAGRDDPQRPLAVDEDATPTWPLKIPPARLDALVLTELGVRPRAVDVTDVYIRRDVDDALDRALQPDALAEAAGVVVVRGGPVSGCSRTMVEALSRNLGSRTVLVVATPRVDAAQRRTWPLPALAAIAPTLRDEVGDAPVVWIDHADRHLGKGLTFEVLDQIVAAFPDCVVAMSVDRGRLALPELVPDPVERWLRVASDPHELAPALTDAEVARAIDHLPGASPMRLRWLPAWIAGVDRLRDRYRDGLSAHPGGAAIVHAAATWVRAGLAPTIPADRLPKLVGGPMTPDRLDWATGEIGPGIAMLRPVTTQPDGQTVIGYRVDPAIAAETAAAGRLEQDELRRVLEQVTPISALPVGRVALVAGLDDVAREAFVLAARAADADARALATLHLGVLYERLDDPDRAADAYRREIVLDHPVWGALGALHLGGILEELGRSDEAVVAYERAIATDDPDVAPVAMLNLGWLYEQQRDGDRAERAYEGAVASGHDDAAPTAALNLGGVLEGQRRLREAEHRYRAAVDSGHADAAPMAAVRLGVLLQRLQRGKEARRLLEWVASTTHPEAAVEARVRLGRRVRR